MWAVSRLLTAAAFTGPVGPLCSLGNGPLFPPSDFLPKMTVEERRPDTNMLMELLQPHTGARPPELTGQEGQGTGGTGLACELGGVGTVPLGAR
ncbi:hypothetical protein SKAU_G00270000 [Synaphobranchus kaupii]|uniref:Uncharacterized protein n=1 Tax=Synaphobranchus kaupii TaxID=118154 RepID=A0A9Q1F066_SYNKA|nr:hypothetical protein SKAU_G00270000 [Synaphobranchus kaupii]